MMFAAPYDVRFANDVALWGKLNGDEGYRYRGTLRVFFEKLFDCIAPPEITIKLKPRGVLQKQMERR